MSEIAPAAATAEEVPLPHWVPALLSFVAGYVDVYTFLVLFGLFVAPGDRQLRHRRSGARNPRRRHHRQGDRDFCLPVRRRLDGGADRAGARAESRGPAVDARFRDA